MNKSEFTKVYADRLGVTIKEAENNLATFISTLTECLKNGEYVHVSGFGTFELREKQARIGVNPSSGEQVTIKACKSPNVKFTKSYKALFNK